MTRILTYKQIDRQQWSELVRTSETGTWFQSPEAYDFFASMPELMEPFVYGVEQVRELGNERISELVGICVGYVTKERSAIRQFFTRRAIIIGGPALAKDATSEEVDTLMKAVRKQFKIYDLRFKILNSPIYIETRNFNDFSPWKEAFKVAGFDYMPHLNFHVACSEKETIWERLSENRKRQVRKSGAILEIIENKNKENTAGAEENIKENISKSKMNNPASQDTAYAASSIIANHLDDKQAYLQANCQSLSDNHKELQLSDYSKHRFASSNLYENAKNEMQIREWYQVLAELYRTKVRTPLWPVEFFLEAYRQGIAKFLLAKHEGRIIGGSMVVSDRRTVYEWFECGRNSEYKDQYPSVMATYAGIQLAHQSGCSRYDMMGAGEPRVPYGVRDFKAEFGGKLVEHGRFLCVCKPMLYKIGKLGVKILKHQ